MTTVAEITGAVKRLPQRDLARFRKWFAEYDATVWDRQLESDAAAGKLDALIREAQRDHRRGRTKEL
jgi:predicted esterase